MEDLSLDVPAVQDFEMNWAQAREAAKAFAQACEEDSARIAELTVRVARLESLVAQLIGK